MTYLLFDEVTWRGYNTTWLGSLLSKLSHTTWTQSFFLLFYSLLDAHNKEERMVFVSFIREVTWNGDLARRPSLATKLTIKI